MACKSHTPGQNRVFDYIYDPSFIVSGTKDIRRLNSYATINYAPVQLLTKYNVMFANIPKNQRQIILQKKKILPHFRYKMDKNTPLVIDKSAQISNKSRQSYSKIFGIKKSGIDTKRNTNHANSFHCCEIDASVPNLKLYSEYEKHESQQIQSIPKEKNVGVQTIYRESSAQTKPYLPDAIITADSNDKGLEIIRVANLLQGTDEQPGEYEIKAIERIRKRREWEKSLSNFSSKKDLEKKMILMEAFEWEEWLSREEQIQEIQNMRYEIVENLLMKREKQFKDNSKSQLENSMKRIEAERLATLAKLDNEYNRNLRKLEAKYKKNKETNKYNYLTSIFEEQIPFRRMISMQEYPILSNREYYNKHIRGADKKSEEDKLLKYTPIPIRTRFDDLAKPKKQVKEIQRGFYSEKNLKQLYESLQILQAESHQETPKCVEEKKFNVPKSNEIGVEEDFESESMYQCKVYLQKLIKGRAIQNMIYKEFEKSRDLIKEYRSDHVFSAIKNSLPTEQLPDSKNDHPNSDFEKNSERSSKKIKRQGNRLDNIFNFLNEELKRLQNERRVQALSMLAERERVKREAMKMDLREMENQRHREHDEIYRNVTKCTQDTVTLFLENVLIEEIKLKSCKDAQKQIQSLAKRIDMQANEEILKAEMKKDENISLSHNNEYDDENHDEKTIFDITDNFLFPEIQKRLARKSMLQRQQRHLHAAHYELYGQIENVFRDEDDSDADNGAILRRFIEQVCSSDEILSEKSSTTNIALHDANTAIKKAIKRALSQPDWKKSSLEKVINNILHKIIDTFTDDRVTTTTTATISSRLQNNELLENIISEINTKLWNYAYENAERESHSNLEVTSILTTPAFINLLEYRKRMLEMKNIECESESESPQNKDQKSTSDNHEEDKLLLSRSTIVVDQKMMGDSYPMNPNPVKNEHSLNKNFNIDLEMLEQSDISEQSENEFEYNSSDNTL